MTETEQDWPWRPELYEARTGQGWYLLARFVMVGLGMLVLTYALDIAGSWWSAHQIATWIDDPTTIRLSQAQRVDNLNQGFSLVEALLALITGVLFVCWLFQAYRRPLPSPSELTLRRGWTIGAWFVPIANLVLPYRVIANLDRATSRPTTRADRVIGWWWAAYLVFAILRLFNADAFSETGGAPGQIMQDLHSREVADVEVAVVAVIAAVLAMLMVHRITERVRTPAVLERTPAAWEEFL